MKIPAPLRCKDLHSSWPCRASPADGKLFVDRGGEIETIARANRLGFNVYIHGPRGSGATSLLHYVSTLLDQAVYISLDGITSLTDVTAEIAGRFEAGNLQRSGRVDRPVHDPSIAPLTRVEAYSNSGHATVLADDLDAVVVFDDTDRWLTAADGPSIEAFFREIMRWLTEFETSIVVATHDHYLNEGDGRRELLEFLDTPIHLPRVPSADALAGVLERRIQVHTHSTTFASASLTDAIAPASVAFAYETYDSGTPLRRIIQLIHVALAEAVSDESEVIGVGHLRVASA